MISMFSPSFQSKRFSRNSLFSKEKIAIVMHFQELVCPFMEKKKKN